MVLSFSLTSCWCPNHAPCQRDTGNTRISPHEPESLEGDLAKVPRLRPPYTVAKCFPASLTNTFMYWDVPSLCYNLNSFTRLPPSSSPIHLNISRFCFPFPTCQTAYLLNLATPSLSSSAPLAATFSFPNLFASSFGCAPTPEVRPATPGAVVVADVSDTAPVGFVML